MFGLTFDDGVYLSLRPIHRHRRLTLVQPVTIADASPKLYDFMKQNSIKATHFMIGSNILTAPTQFLTAFSDLQSRYNIPLSLCPYS